MFDDGDKIVIVVYGGFGVGDNPVAGFVLLGVFVDLFPRRHHRENAGWWRDNENEPRNREEQFHVVAID